MPDYPYVYTPLAVLPVAPGGTRVRLFRRRPRDQGSDEHRQGQGESEDQTDSVWRSLIEEAIRELNAELGAAGAPFVCVLEEDEAGLALHVRQQDGRVETSTREEEYLEAADLPRWLSRLRSRLGILLDQTA